MISLRRIINFFKLHLEYIPDATQRKRRNWAAFLLIFMSMQHVMFEGNPLSWPKMITMAISPIVLLCLKVTRFSCGLWLGLLYWLTICFTSYLHPYPVNHMSIWFTFPFILLFGTYHTLIVNRVISLRDFEKILLWVISMYVLFLIIQQVCYLVGIHRIVLFNRWRALGFKFQSLGLEPSYAARLIGAYSFAYFEILRIKHGEDLSFNLMWNKYRWQIIGIIYFFITLGSGTGWGVLGFLSAYQMWHGKKLLALVCLIAILAIPSGIIEARDRLMNTAEATLTLDIDNVWETDQSAAFRVGVLFNFIKGFKPNLYEFWVGQGAYTNVFQNVGIISLYGFISWIMQILQFSICCFRKVISFEVLYFIVFVTLCVGNVVNLWAIMMVFATLKNFYTENKYIMK